MAEPLVVEIIGDLSKLKQQFGAMLPKMPAKGKGGGLGDLSMLTGSLAKLTGAIGILIGAFQASKRLQRAIELLMRPINQLLALFGDLLSMALMPIARALQPIARFIRELRRTMRKADLSPLDILLGMGPMALPYWLGKWLWEKITGAIGDLSPDLGKVGGDVYTSIIDAIGDLATSLGTLGGDLYRGIMDAIGSFVMFPLGIGTWIKGQIETFLNFGSPWNLGEEIIKKVKELLGWDDARKGEFSMLGFGAAAAGGAGAGALAVASMHPKLQGIQEKISQMNLYLDVSGGSEFERSLKQTVEETVRTAIMVAFPQVALLKAMGWGR